MKLSKTLAVLLGLGLVTAAVYGQQSKPPEQQKPPAEANPFPEDSGNVPVLPSRDAPVPAPSASGNGTPSALPPADADPVRSPDDPRSDADTSVGGFSSSSSGLDRIVPPADDEPDRAGKRGRRGALVPEHQETAAEDEKVGDYYMSEGNWKAALSRYESAVVLDPENPDVYWGLGEAQRHLGKLAEAKASYEKLVEYDPDGKHGKEAKKILKSSEIAGAKAQ